MQELFLLVEEGTIKLPFIFPYVPWWIVRALGYVRQIKNVYQGAQMDSEPKSAMPLRHFWLDAKRTNAWFKARRESQRAMAQAHIR
jgi:hypothetical protein